MSFILTMNPEKSLKELSYKELKKNFAGWLADWSTDQTPDEQLPIDLMQVVQLLQAIGFTIHKMERPRAGCTALIDTKGVRVTVECTNSNQFCTMELPLPKEYCNCVKKIETSDALGKILTPMFADPRPITDYTRYKEFIPGVPTQVQQVVSEVMNHLIRMLREIATPPTKISRQYGSLDDIIKKLELFRCAAQVDFSKIKSDAEPSSSSSKNRASPDTTSKHQPDSTEANVTGPDPRRFLYSTSPPLSSSTVVNDPERNAEGSYLADAESLSGPVALVAESAVCAHDPVGKISSQSILEAELKEALDM